MIKIQDYIKCYTNMIGKELREKIIEGSGDFKKSTVRDGDISQDRNCYDSTLNKKFNDSMYESVGKILQRYQNDFTYFTTGLTTEDTGYQHLLYKGSEKGEYRSHVDHFDLHPRVLSCSIILNDNYEGGDFSFFDGEHIIKKQAGSAVVFPSNFCFPHAVTPVTNGDRHAIITWIH
jgi:predicted 2-oxoglutarate/Fe(II)-dependent dioxygenase YbiX